MYVDWGGGKEGEGGSEGREGGEGGAREREGERGEGAFPAQAPGDRPACLPENPGFRQALSRIRGGGRLP